MPYITSVQKSEAKECQKAIEEIKSEKEETEEKENENLSLKKIESEKTIPDPNDPILPPCLGSNCPKCPNGPNCPLIDKDGNEIIPLSKLHSINDVNLLSVKPTDLPNLTKSLSNLV